MSRVMRNESTNIPSFIENLSNFYLVLSVCSWNSALRSFVSGTREHLIALQPDSWFAQCILYKILSSLVFAFIRNKKRRRSRGRGMEDNAEWELIFPRVFSPKDSNSCTLLVLGLCIWNRYSSGSVFLHHSQSGQGRSEKFSM